MTVPYAERRSFLEMMFGSSTTDEDWTGDQAQISDETAKLVSIFKTLGHEGRFMILCYLIQGERSVAEFETLLAARQSTVSQHLARLRMEGLVRARRDGNMIYYSLADQQTADIILACTQIMSSSTDSTSE